VVPLLSGLDETGAVSDASFLATGVIGATTDISVDYEGVRMTTKTPKTVPTTSEHPRLAIRALYIVRHCGPVQF